MIEKKYLLEKTVYVCNYNYYVLECLHCHNKVFVSKNNDLTKVLEDKCIKCHNEDIKYLFVGEGNLERNLINIPVPIDKNSDTYILNNIVKSGLKKKNQYVNSNDKEFYDEEY